MTLTQFALTVLANLIAVGIWIGSVLAREWWRERRPREQYMRRRGDR